MKNYVFFLMIWVLAGSNSIQCSEKVLNFAADLWCPYSCRQNADEPGFLVELAQLAFEKAGYKVDYKVIPWSRAIAMTREGKLDGILGAYKSDAPDFIFPRLNQIVSVSSFWVLKDSSWKYEGIQSLVNITLGISLGYSYGQEIDQFIYHNQNNPARIQFASGENPIMVNFEKLFNKRITTVLEDRNVAKFFLQSTQNLQKVKEAGSLKEEKVYIAFSPEKPDSVEYAKILTEAMIELKNSGELEKLYKKYHMNYTEPNSKIETQAAPLKTNVD